MPIALVDDLDDDSKAEEAPHTEWANEPTVADLKQDFTDASPDHDEQVTKIDIWLDNLNIEGAAKIKKKTGHSSVVPQLIRKQAEWRYAALSEPLLSTEDIFNTAPVSYEDKAGAVQNGLVLNNQFNTKIKKVKFINDFVRTAVDEGTVITRTGWELEEEEVEVEVPDYAVVPVRDAVKAQQMVLQGQQPVEQIIIGTHIETITRTIKNQPTVEVVDYHNVTIDPTCMGDIDKAGFVVYSFETSLSELEKNPDIYFNLDQINLAGSDILGEPDHESSDNSSFNFSDKPRKKFVAYEYWGFWDIDDTGLVKPIVATWVGNVMIRLEDNPFPDGKLPFTVTQYLPIRRSIYGEPDGALLEDNQKIVGAVTRGMIDIMGRSANGQMGSRKDALDVTNKRKFDRGLDYEFNGGIDPRLAFHMHTFPEIPQSAGLMLQLQNNEAESLTGVKAFSSGIGGDSLGTTATGVRSTMDATSKRELDILLRLAEGIKQIGRKFLSMNAEFLSPEEVIRVTNEEFVTVRRDDLAGEFDLSLTISTAEADNEKAQELAFMLQTTGQTMGPEFSQIILSEIAKLRKMPTLAKEIENYQSTPDPLAQKIQQLEIAKLEAEIQKINSEALENRAEAQLDQAKTQTEQARVRNINSDSDMKDLDFVENESGVTHARDVDRITSQAEAQAKTKIIDNLTKKDKPTK